MKLGRWLHSIVPSKKYKVPARWLQPNENFWGLTVLDCAEYAQNMMSFTGNPEIAKKYGELRRATGREWPALEFKPIQSVPCNLTYKITRLPADGPVFKSSMMEEKWDIYLYNEHFFFCRSWGGELIHRAVVKSELPTLTVLKVESSQELPENRAVRQVDFLVKSHLMLAIALHPLPFELGQDVEKQAAHSFACYGNKGRYGTFEETIGTPYYWNQSPVTGA
jgi:hypothetical protein